MCSCGLQVSGSAAALNNTDMNEGDPECEVDRENTMEEGRDTPSSQQELIPQDQTQHNQQMCTEIRE